MKMSWQKPLALTETSASAHVLPLDTTVKEVPGL